MPEDLKTLENEFNQHLNRLATTYRLHIYNIIRNNNNQQLENLKNEFKTIAAEADAIIQKIQELQLSRELKAKLNQYQKYSADNIPGILVGIVRNLYHIRLYQIWIELCYTYCISHHLDLASLQASHPHRE